MMGVDGAGRDEKSNLEWGLGSGTGGRINNP